MARACISTSLILSVKVYKKCAATGLLMPGLPKKWKDFGGIPLVAGIPDEGTILRSTLPVFRILTLSPCRVGYFSSNYCAFLNRLSYSQQYPNTHRLLTRPTVARN